jgi:hypothetical protein
MTGRNCLLYGLGKRWESSLFPIGRLEVIYAFKPYDKVLSYCRLDQNSFLGRLHFRHFGNSCLWIDYRTSDNSIDIRRYSVANCPVLSPSNRVEVENVTFRLTKAFWSSEVIFKNNSLRGLGRSSFQLWAEFWKPSWTTIKLVSFWGLIKYLRYILQ